MFDPNLQYEVVPGALPIRDCRDDREELVVRSPYQQESVWSKKRKGLQCCRF
jgi:hypothetical protein